MVINGLNGFHYAIGNTPPRYYPPITMLRFPDCPLMSPRVFPRAKQGRKDIPDAV